MGTIVLIGCHCWMDCVHDRLILLRWTLVCPPTAGSFSLLREKHFRTEVLWPRLAPTQQVLMRWTSLLGCAVFALLALPSATLPVCFFSDACGFPCPCLLELPVWPSTRRPWPPPRSVIEAGVLASRGCSVESVVQGSAARQVPASPPTYSCGTWTCQLHVTSPSCQATHLSRALGQSWPCPVGCSRS